MGEARAPDRRSSSAARHREILAEVASEHYNHAPEKAGGLAQITWGTHQAYQLVAAGHWGFAPDD